MTPLELKAHFATLAITSLNMNHAPCIAKFATTLTEALLQDSTPAVAPTPELTKEEKVAVVLTELLRSLGSAPIPELCVSVTLLENGNVAVYNLQGELLGTLVDQPFDQLANAVVHDAPLNLAPVEPSVDDTLSTVMRHLTQHAIGTFVEFSLGDKRVKITSVSNGYIVEEQGKTSVFAIGEQVFEHFGV